jgi:hypothetical protein
VPSNRERVDELEHEVGVQGALLFVVAAAVVLVILVLHQHGLIPVTLSALFKGPGPGG